MKKYGFTEAELLDMDATVLRQYLDLVVSQSAPARSEPGGQKRFVSARKSRG